MYVYRGGVLLKNSCSYFILCTSKYLLHSEISILKKYNDHDEHVFTDSNASICGIVSNEKKNQNRGGLVRVDGVTRRSEKTKDRS